MVDIFNAEIAGGGPAGQRDFRIDVTYRAVFDPAERNLEFSEFVRLRESDEVGVDDDLTPANPVSFVPGTETVGRRISINVPREVLDTEFGEEEVYAEVWLCSPENIVTDPVEAETRADRFVRTARRVFNP